jgi:hypothetical protein
MAMLYARALLPGWAVVLGLAAFFAPAGIATTVLLVAAGLACIPAVITAGVSRRSAARGLDPGDQEPAAIDAAFTVQDSTPTDDRRGMKEHT